MKNLITLIIFSTILFSCNSPIDSSPWSGTINQNDEKTKIVEKLAKGYETGTFEIASWPAAAWECLRSINFLSESTTIKGKVRD